MTTGVIVYNGGGWYDVPGLDHPVKGRVAARRALTQQVNVTSPSRSNLLRRAGYQYRGERDVYTTAGYVAEDEDDFDYYWSLYQRNPIAGRIIDMPPKSTWKEDAEVFEGEVPADKPTKFDVQWREMVERLKLWREFEKVDRVGRVGQYAVLLLGARKGDDDRGLTEPLEDLKGPDDILYVSSYAQKYATIERWEQNTQSPRFGLPLIYKVNLSSGVAGFTAETVQVHYTRVIHVAEDPLVDNVHGRPALKRVLNALTDTLKVSASTGEAYWQLAARIWQAQIDKDMDMSPAKVTELGENLEDMVHDLRRQFVGHGVELSTIGGETPDPSGPFEMFKALNAVGSGIPIRILFGSEQGQQASNQDERAYFGMVSERQEHHAEPNILRGTIDRFIEVGALPKPEKGYTVVWPTLFEESDASKAEANAARAQAAKALTAMGGDPMELVEVDETGRVQLLPQTVEEARAKAEAAAIRIDDGV